MSPHTNPYVGDPWVEAIGLGLGAHETKTRPSRETVARVRHPGTGRVCPRNVAG
jgi:hypothetical protein